MNRKPRSINGVLVPYDAPMGALRTPLQLPGPHAWAACVALGQHPNPTAFRLLVDLLSCPDWRYRRAAVGALAAHPHGREAATLLHERLSDPVPYVVWEACRAITALMVEDAHDAVVVLLRADLGATRIEALRTLAALWRPDDFALVFAVFSADPVEAVRRQAAWTLRANVNVEIWQQLFEVWWRDPLPRYRSWASELAGAFGDRRVMYQLQDLRADPDGHVRKAAHLAQQQINEAHTDDAPPSNLDTNGT